MTIGFNVVLALFILAPGFGAAMALWASQRHKSFRPAAPPTTSTITLAVVAIGALVAHTVGAIVFGIAAEGLVAFCEYGGVCIGSGEPNPYAVLLHAGDGAVPASSWEIMWTLVTLVLLTVGTMAVTHHEVGKGTFAPLLYGWMADVLRDSARDDRYVIAYILTDIKKGEDHLVGYQGLLDDMNLGSDKNIVSVTLTDAAPFYVKLGDEKLERIYAAKETPFARLHFEKDEIKNIVLDVREFQAEEDEAADAEGARPATVH